MERTKKFIINVTAFLLKVPAFYMCLTAFEKLGYNAWFGFIFSISIMLAYGLGHELERHIND